MIKKILALLTFAFVLISPVQAITTSSSGSGMVKETIVPDNMMPIVDPADPMLLPIFGEDHAYSVTLRGNGEAVVNMRVALSNFEEQPNKDITLTFSGETSSEVAVYQIVKEKQCISYDEKKLDCLQYQEPNYYDYWGSNTKYYKAEVVVKGQQIQISLPYPIEEGKTGSYVLFMRTTGYIKKVFGGAHQYHFETLRTNAPIRNVNIGISSDTEMKFKGAESQVYYQDITGSSTMIMTMTSKREAFQSTDFDNYISQIGQGQMYKNTSNLSLGDTYVVEGTYAKSIVSLYLKEAFIILSSIIFVFLTVIGVVYFFMKRRRKNPPLDEMKPVLHTRAMIMAITAGFVSGLGVAVYTIFLIGISRMMESWSYYSFNMIGMLLLSVFSFGVYAAILFGPAIFAGVKRGIWWGVGVFGMTFGWIVLFLLIIGGYYFISQAKGVTSYPELPVPMMRDEIQLPPPPVGVELPKLAE